MGKQSIVDTLHSEVVRYKIPLKQAPISVLDIGANIGMFSAMASEMWPDAKILSYEPVPEVFNQLQERSKGNRNICPINRAVRSFEGDADILLGDCLTTSGFHKLDRQSDNKMSVSCASASEIESCEFVKIDTEGCEVEILCHLDLSETKGIALEYHTEVDKQFIHSFMEDAGFVPYRNYSCNKNLGILRYVRKGMELDLTKEKLFIGLPIYFGVDPHFFKSAMKLMAEFSVNCKIQPLIGDSLIPRARNTLSRMFLESDCSHLLMIDSDLVFSSEQIKRILSHDEDIVGGFYPKKKEGAIEMVCNALNPQPPMDERRLTPLKYIGSGFICISRRVFEKMIEVYGSTIEYYLDEHEEIKEWDFWSVGIYNYPDGTKRYLSEDWYFCQRALDAGFTVYGDNGITLRHSGSAVYPLQHQLETQPIFSPNTTDSAGSVTEAVSPRFQTEPALIP